MSPADDIVGWVSNTNNTVTVLDTWSPDYNQVPHGSEPLTSANGRQRAWRQR
eukprot:m.65229 g.65229  ORF g.65229 m.65229 type:complete len:52 (+) comp7312_c0_seq1:1047-1202(+)